MVGGGRGVCWVGGNSFLFCKRKGRPRDAKHSRNHRGKRFVRNYTGTTLLGGRHVAKGLGWCELDHDRNSNREHGGTGLRQLEGVNNRQVTTHTGISRDATILSTSPLSHRHMNAHL